MRRLDPPAAPEPDPGPPPRDSAVPDRREWRFALLVAAAFVVAAGWGAFHHELWRDEAQSWLLARDSTSPLAVLRNTRYDGHPALWFLLLWPITHLSRSVGAMQAVHVLVGAAGALLVARFAPAPRWVRAIAALGYFPLYEYGVIARNYGLGFLFLVAFCAAFPRRRERPLLAGLLLALAANTSFPAAVLALAGAAALAVDARRAEAGPARRGLLGAVALAGAGVLIGALQMMPPPDTGYMTGWRLGVDGAAAGTALRTVVAGWIPLPRPGADSWGSSVLKGIPGFAAWGALLSAALLAAAAAGLRRRPVALAAFATGSLGLLAFFYVKSAGYIRHHGFLFVALGMALWLARLEATGGPAPAAADAGPRRLRVLFAFLLCVHLGAGAVALATEHALSFSGARATAGLIRSQGLDRLPMVVHQDWRGLAVLAYLDKDRAWYPAGSRWGSYVTWDAARTIERNPWAEALRLAASSGGSVMVLLDADAMEREPLPEPLRGAVRGVGCRAGEILPDESFCAFVLDRERIPRWLERLAQ